MQLTHLELLRTRLSQSFPALEMARSDRAPRKYCRSRRITLANAAGLPVTQNGLLNALHCQNGVAAHPLTSPFVCIARRSLPLICSINSKCLKTRRNSISNRFLCAGCVPEVDL